MRRKLRSYNEMYLNSMLFVQDKRSKYLTLNDVYFLIPIIFDMEIKINEFKAKMSEDIERFKIKQDLKLYKSTDRSRQYHVLKMTALTLGINPYV